MNLRVEVLIEFVGIIVGAFFERRPIMDANVITMILILVAIFLLVCVMGVLFTRSSKKREKENMTKMGEDI